MVYFCKPSDEIPTESVHALSSPPLVSANVLALRIGLHPTKSVRSSMILP